MAADLKAVPILIPGSLYSHAAARIETEFRCLRVAAADPALVTPEMAQSVRGMAASTRIDARFLDALPNLEIIANFGVGYDGIDARYAAERGVMVTNTPDVLTEEVADLALGLLIATVRELPRAERWLREGRWSGEGAYPLTRGSLRGRSLGIFGMGRIGLAIARRAQGFGLPVSYHNRRRVADVPFAYHDTLESLAQAVDTLVCVAPGTPETRNAVNASVLRALGSNGVFVNVGRGSTVDEAALAQALADGTILAAGLDVFADEPHVHQSLLECPNAVFLPHVASASIRTRNAMGDLVADNLRAWFGEGRALTPVPETQGIAETRRRLSPGQEK